MNKIKGFIITTAMLLNASVFAAGSEIDARAELVASLYSIVTVFALLLGLGLMALGAVKLKRRAENPNDARSFPLAIMMTFLSGALIFNFSGTSSTLIATLLGSDAGHCFVLHDKLDSTGGGNMDLHAENCWSSADSSEIDEIASKVDEMTDGGGDKLKENFDILVAIFQWIGLIYLIIGIYNLQATASGNGKDGYMKPIVTMITAALVIDLPHTLQIINETVKLLGFGGG